MTSTEGRESTVWQWLCLPRVLGDVRRSGIEDIVLVLRRQPVLVLLLESGHQ